MLIVTGGSDARGAPVIHWSNAKRIVGDAPALAEGTASAKADCPRTTRPPAPALRSRPPVHGPSGCGAENAYACAPSAHHQQFFPKIAQ